MKKAKDQSTQDSDKLIYYSIFILVVSVLVVLIFIVHHVLDSRGHAKLKDEAGNSDFSSRIPADKVGRHYRDTYMKKYFQERRIDNEVIREEATRGLTNTGTPLPQNNESGWPSIYAEPEQAGRFNQEKPKFEVNSSQDVIQKQLIDEQQMALESEREREEFVRQFIENARRQGVEVQVDKNLRVYPRGTTPQ